ncbi:hypothetical protein BGX31_011027 [Mortierella sp. GBA43]|nr:hypothetical protein BGX31_011027 [Mortierella sp. GBA43]
MFNITELNNLVYSHLERDDLARCARVNKEWHEWVIPFLWHDLTFPYYARNNAFCKLVVEDFFHNRWQQLEKESGKNMDQCIDTMKLDSNYFTSDLWEIITQDVVLQVRHLNIGEGLETAGIPSWKLKYLLGQLSATMECLTLEADISHKEDEATWTDVNEWPSFKELALLKNLGSFEPEPFWSWLWMQCHHVEKLQVTTLEEFDTSKLVNVMLTYMPNLDTIQLQADWCDCQELDDEPMAQLLSGSRKGWRAISVRDNQLTWDASPKAILAHIPTLEELVIDGSVGFTGKELVQVLSSCPNLRTLIAIDDGPYNKYAEFSHVDAQLLIDRDPSTDMLNAWPCETSLKVLKISIIGIPRLDLESPDYVQEAYPGQGREIQNLVYKRLGRLTKLETLWLGHDPDVNGRTYQLSDWCTQLDCLEMSLESGLGELSGLRELREFSMARMDRDIGADEIRWMIWHWPKLETIYGLEREQKDEVIAGWLDENFPWINAPGVRVDEEDETENVGREEMTPLAAAYRLFMMLQDAESQGYEEYEEDCWVA